MQVGAVVSIAEAASVLTGVVISSLTAVEAGLAAVPISVASGLMAVPISVEAVGLTAVSIVEASSSTTTNSSSSVAGITTIDSESGDPSLASA